MRGLLSASPPTHRIVIVVLTAVLAPGLAAQVRPDFSGAWTLDAARSGPSRDVWGQNRPSRFVITQTPSDFAVDTGDVSIVGVTGTLFYKLDGTATTVLDRTLGDLPGFTRKIRTEASWDGKRVVTRTTHFAETRSGESRQPQIVRGGITRVLIFSLLPDGAGLSVERTGFRGLPPRELHGRPYRQEDDFVYGRDTAIYVRAAR